MAQKLIVLLFFGLFIQCKVESQTWGSIKGEGEVVKKDIQLDAFHAIGLSISGELVLTQGSTQKVTIEGQQNVIDNIKRKIENGRWVIEFDKNVRDAKPVKITVTVPSLDEIDLSGSGSIASTNKFTGTGDFDLNVSGSGKINLNMESKSTDLRLSGSGNITLEGNTGSFDIHISGSGDVTAKDFKSTSCDVSISGSGDAMVNVDGDLDTAISGSGDVTYTGNANVHANISGSGSVSKKQ